MKKIILLIVLTFFVSDYIVGQNNQNEKILLAKKLYENGDFSEAALLFKDLYSNKTSSKIYANYFDCLLKTNDFKKAISIAKNYYKKKGENPSILIDLGKAYSLYGDDESAEKQFSLAIEQAKDRPNFLLSVASKFYKLELYIYALDAYNLLKERNPKGNYSFQISNIYSYLGNIESMYQELLDLMLTNPSYIQTCKNKIRITINDSPENNNNILLKNLLIKRIQKTDSIILNEILIWVYLQENNFSNALKQEISIDKRFGNRDVQIFDLGEIAISNSSFSIAQEAFDYITKKSPLSIYYQESIIKSLEIKYSVFKKNPIKKSSALMHLIEGYEKAIEEIGMTNESLILIRELAHILAFYNDELEKAKSLLISILSKQNYSDQNLAYCKLELGDILLIENDIWEAKLYYSQVENMFKNDILGQEAKFKKIKIDYYTGNFNWAQAQLDILKNSTSKLIANNAMELSLLIGDNLNLDTTQVPLQLYAEAELLIFQNNYDNAIKKFNTIENIYPNHSLTDNILFYKANIELERKNYELGLSYLEEICENYYYDILFDDALYKQAYVLEFGVKDYEKAKKKYEELLIKCPSSIFVADSRKRYKTLRKLNP